MKYFLSTTEQSSLDDLIFPWSLRATTWSNSPNGCCSCLEHWNHFPYSSFYHSGVELTIVKHFSSENIVAYILAEFILLNQQISLSADSVYLATYLAGAESGSLWKAGGLWEEEKPIRTAVYSVGLSAFHRWIWWNNKCRMATNKGSFLGMALYWEEFYVSSDNPILRGFPRLTIRNNSSFRPKHLGVPNGSNGSYRTSYHWTENYPLPVAQVTGRVA
jgi:hypothetical protein